jgi:hypothetical protein
MRLVWIVTVIALFYLPAAAQQPATRPSVQIGRIEHPALSESSGIVASRTQAGVFWTHNDSGNDPVLFAIDRFGKSLGEWRVGAGNSDWEDIAIDDQGRLYIADIGNNGRKRPEVCVLRLPEPRIGDAAARPLQVERSWRLHYAGGERFDSEALFIHGGQGYLVSKDIGGRPARLFRFDLDGEGDVRTLAPVAALPVRTPVTGADISPDGAWLALITVTGPRILRIDGDPARAADADVLSAVYLNANMEAITFVDEGVLATTEGRQILLFTWEQLRGGAILIEPPRGDLRIPRRVDPLEIDGSTGDWRHAAALELRCATAGAPPGALRAAWDEAGLWLAIRVPDESVSDLAAEWFAGDCVEVFIGPQAPGRSADYGDGDERFYAGFAGPHARVAMPDGPVPEGARAAGRIEAGRGYELELFLPRRGMRAGGQIRLDVSALSRVPRRNWYLSTSNAAGTWSSPLRWAVVNLD